MVKVNLNELQLAENTAKTKKGMHCFAAFPLTAFNGTKESATVYFELDSGEELGSHTDSAEELLLILDGDVEITIGDETDEASKGEIALVPKMVSHNIINTGDTKAKVLGFFGGANNIVATFEDDWMPADTNIVDTEKLFAEMTG